MTRLKRVIFYFRKNVFLFGFSFKAFGANFCFLAINFFGLQIYLEFSFGCYVGVTARISSSCASFAYFTYSAHDYKFSSHSPKSREIMEWECWIVSLIYYKVYIIIVNEF